MTNDKCFAYYDLLKSNLFFATQKNVELYFDDWIWHKIHRKKKTCFTKKKRKNYFHCHLKKSNLWPELFFPVSEKLKKKNKISHW